MTTKISNLPDLASKINADYTTLQSGDKQRRKLIIAIGKGLIQAQKQCKVEGITFDEWRESSVDRTLRKTQCQQYMAIARYPSVFKGSMSIDQGAKLCRYARKHGGELPVKEWKGGDHRTLISFQRKIGRVLTPTGRLIKEFSKKAETESWTKDERLGAIETLEELRKQANKLLQLLKNLQ
jgi:hypothetical protein